jgi:hypothetical protein
MIPNKINMPKYRYKCNDCNIEFFIHHSISEKLRNCEYCGTIDSLNKLPTVFTTNKKTNKADTKVGSIVKSSIEEFRKDLDDEKKYLKGQEYKE